MKQPEPSKWLPTERSDLSYISVLQHEPRSGTSVSRVSKNTLMNSFHWWHWLHDEWTLPLCLHVSVCGRCQCVACVGVWRVSVCAVYQCIELMTSLANVMQHVYKWRHHSDGKFFLTNIHGDRLYISIPIIGLRLDNKSLKSDMGRLSNNGNTLFCKLWEHLRVFHNEYPSKVPSGTQRISIESTILLSWCHHGEPIVCPQSGQNTLETNP